MNVCGSWTNGGENGRNWWFMNGNERSTLINILKLYACHWIVGRKWQKGWIKSDYGSVETEKKNVLLFFISI